jgi:hypothetical protein
MNESLGVPMDGSTYGWEYLNRSTCMNEEYL